MLLLPTSLVESKAWQALQAQDLDDLYKSISRCMKVTHIAINKPIPLHIHSEDSADHSENRLRAPVHFQPLYGNFGSAETSSPPSGIDLSHAYWVTAKQNGIAQTWAPRWTMFSRGNISEKARLLKLDSVAKAVQDGPCSAVDLYAGIGYFAFSYARAGVSTILCWELNLWSCEGLRRGADANRWSHKTVDLDENDSPRKTELDSARIVVFEESNENALRRLQGIDQLPPVRHVNCGLLPTSQPSWHIAVQALSAELGGWIHVHENFAIHEIDDRAERVREAFERILAVIAKSRDGTVLLETVHRVKSYAPGVWHCVVDIRIPRYEPNGVRIDG